ncbi:precorrin-6A reductase [Desulfatitalea alkaliphila]|uniref:Precorrin-6A reductase n=1 Tax=Desulfatitalea alkaliphila TaxID=2929485 RepID=A0AA41R280_9BACT|nr:precorrin-6A reductase [Desulfatitalea alkaliphila]MCJ8499945.1 precorrin-6A reductase [Desulfatitalea alkaliphila]
MAGDAPGLPAVILLLGGTSEAVPIAMALVAQGHAVLLSSATDAPLRDPLPPGVRCRSGPLDKDGMVALIRRHAIACVVDATHPYAGNATANARDACRAAGVPCLRFERPAVDVDLQGIDLRHAADHSRAAVLACAPRKSILLTVGSRHVHLYSAAARSHDLPLWARVLDHPASIAACREAGLRPDRIITGRGPFSEQQTGDLIRRHGIGVLVTKESGAAGGLTAKIAAARSNHCVVVLVDRPPAEPGAVHSIDALLSKTKL